MPEILATLEDVNANLDGQVITGTDVNTALIQVSVSRVVRAYLSKVIQAATLAGWTNPELTPDIIREIAGKLIASQLYFNETARSTVIIDDQNYAQRLYNEAIGFLDKIVLGEMDLGQIGGEEPPPVETIYTLNATDFFPVDDTDRAFTMGMEL